MRLAMAADALRKRGFRLRVRDCTRSLAAQKALFAAHRIQARSRPRRAACMRGVSPPTRAGGSVRRTARDADEVRRIRPGRRRLYALCRNGPAKEHREA